MASLGQSAEFANLDVHDVHRLQAVGPEQDRQSVDALVEDERVVGHLPDRVTFLERLARLLDVNVDVFHGANDSRGLVHEPAGVGIGIQHFPGLHAGGNFTNATDISQWVFADLDLKVAVALCAIFRNAGSHGVWIGACDYLVQFDFVLLFAAEQGVHGEVGHFAENIPAGHVDR